MAVIEYSPPGGFKKEYYQARARALKKLREAVLAKGTTPSRRLWERKLKQATAHVKSRYEAWKENYVNQSR